MTSNFVQTIGSNFNAATTILTITPSANTMVGNTIIVAATAASAHNLSSVSDTGGNTYSIDSNSAAVARTGAIAHAYITTALTPSDTITVTMSGSGGTSIAAYEFQFLLATSFDKQNVTQGTTIATLAAGTTGALSQTNELAFTMVGVATSQAFVPPNGYNEVLPSGVGGTLDCAWLLVNSTAAQNPTWSWGGAVNATAAIATYKLEVRSTFSQNRGIKPHPFSPGVAR